jgi:FAD/FMN-containing dehydrogenase
MDHGSTRRQLLTRSAGAVAALALPPDLLNALLDRPTAALGLLGQRLRGRLLTPSDAGWPAAKALYNPRLNVEPRLIALCEKPQDVSDVVVYARQNGLPLAARGGRHSFAGYSNAAGGIVADVSSMRSITYDPAGATALVGAGANVLDVYRELVLARGVEFPVGTCPTVGIAGLTLGGGFGRTMRRAGITADSLREATVVLADGRVVVCNATSQPELFWALRGGGAGMGVVLSMRFAVAPVAAPIRFSITYQWPQAAAAIDAWQRSMPQASKDLGFGRFRAIRFPDGQLSAIASGHWYGSQAALGVLLAPLLAAGPISANIRPVTAQVAAAPDRTTRNPDGTVTAVVLHDPNYQRSDFVDALLPPAAIAALVAQVERWPGGGPTAHEGGVQLDALGGAVNDAALDATSFVHRRSLFHIAYLSFWGNGDSAAIAAADTQWVRDIHGAMAPYASGAAYQNYIDPELVGWEKAYYGQNLGRLRLAKRRYDPRNAFAFAQGVAP